MTGFIFPIARGARWEKQEGQKGKARKGGRAGGKVWVFCFWFPVFFLAVFTPAGQGQTAAKSDWSSLEPPPGAVDTNSFRADLGLTNVPPGESANFASLIAPDGTNTVASDLAMAAYYKRTSQPEKAEPILVGLLASNYPDSVQKAALMALADVVRGENDLPRAQSIYAQFLERWPDDPTIPEVLLRQGEIFRQMGLTDSALGKFYSVMASAIDLKSDQFGYYQKLVLQTQVEIAETHYLMGHYVDAADFYKRLLANSDPTLNRPQMQFRLVRSLTIIRQYDEAASQAQDFLSRYADAPEVPEVRYYLAQALKALGRDDEALEQVILCLKQTKAQTSADPQLWLYWQQRVGNEIANQLYRKGDYTRALEIYTDLAQLDSTPAWQIPVYYQMGLSYEKLLQPQKAVDAYNQILARETQVGTNASPGMQAVFDMAQWRINFLKWQTNAQAVDQSLAAAAAAAAANFKTNSTQ